MIATVLMVLAMLCFALDAFGANPIRRVVQLLPLGLALWVLALLIGNVHLVGNAAR